MKGHNHKPGEECALCALGGDIDKFRRGCLETIDRHGRVVMGIKDAEVPWAYTIGHSVSHPPLPEMILLGIADEDASRLLNIIGDLQRRRGVPLLGDVDLGDGALVRVQAVRNPVHVRSEYMGMHSKIYPGGTFEVSQVLIPCPHGHIHEAQL